MLKLKNPIVFLDLETTGIDATKDRIVEISMIKVLPSGEEQVKTRRVNPQMPIPAGASAIHGIYDDDVKDCPAFGQMAKSLATWIEGCDLAGFNSNRFDIPLLVEEFMRAGVDMDLKKRKFVDVQTIFHKMEQRTLVAAYKFYCDKSLENAHSAEADTRATYEVLLAQIDRYPDLGTEVESLAEYSNTDKNVDFAGRVVFDENGVEVFNFGKHRGESVAKVFAKDQSYYSWMMNGDFPQYTKKVITEIKLRK